jgi:hypothetical protein
MESFGAANSAYQQHFPVSNPAARACVQALLPPGVAVAVDVLFAHGTHLAKVGSQAVKQLLCLCCMGSQSVRLTCVLREIFN